MDLGLGLHLPRRRAPAIISAVYDTDAEALFPRFTNAPSRPRRKIISDTIVALKSTGAWPLLDAFYMTAAADAHAARQNWKVDVYNLVAVNAPIFLADRYYAGNATSSYLDTGFNPTVRTPSGLNVAAGPWVTSTTGTGASAVEDSAGALTLTGGGSPNEARGSKAFPTEVGVQYAIELTAAISGTNIHVGSTLGGSGVYSNSFNAGANVRLNFTASSTTSYLAVFKTGTTPSVISNFRVRKTAANKFQQDSASLGIHTLNEVNLADAPIGVNLTTIVPRSGGQAYVRMNDSAGAAASSVAIPSSVGTLVGNRSAQNAQTLRMDGAPLIGVTNASSPPANENFWLCGRNNGTGGQYSARQVAAAFIGGSLTVAQQDSTALAIKSYLASVGAIP